MMPGSSHYAIEYLEVVVKKDIKQLPQTIKFRIKTAIEERLMTNPVTFGKPLRYSLQGHRRLRVGDYRVVYQIDTHNHIVTVVAIKHRKDIYAAH
ncbi:MAG: type II toxin-antitoxin system RelE/ParE family toxin [Bacteroidota bacterium]